MNERVLYKYRNIRVRVHSWQLWLRNNFRFCVHIHQSFQKFIAQNYKCAESQQTIETLSPPNSKYSNVAVVCFWESYATTQNSLTAFEHSQVTPIRWPNRMARSISISTIKMPLFCCVFIFYFPISFICCALCRLWPAFLQFTITFWTTANRKQWTQNSKQRNGTSCGIETN